MKGKAFATPFILPLAAFVASIFAGAFLLSLDAVALNERVAFMDALFIATSAVCVTGLATVDPFTVFNNGGRIIVMVLVQLGGLGIVTYSTLIFYIFSRRISLLDRMAVGQALLHDSTFHLGYFLQRMIIMVFCIEAAGALALYLMEPVEIGAFRAVFLAVTGFCNAGFAPWPDSLIRWQSHWGVNVTIMSLVVCGGIGFFVADELTRIVKQRIRYGVLQWRRKRQGAPGPVPVYPKIRLSYHSRVIISSTIGLILVGALLILVADIGNAAWRGTSFSDRVLVSLFQSVTCRSSGFTTKDIGSFSDVALLVTLGLMFIGGSPGSCAGGIKTTSFRILISYIAAELRGHRQVLVAGRAISRPTLNKTLLLFYFSLLTVCLATFLLAMTENGTRHHGGGPFDLNDLFFEAMSAFTTMGASLNVTPRLSGAGKLIICVVMFIGRLGPVWLITAIQQFQSEPSYRLPEEDLPVG